MCNVQVVCSQEEGEVMTKRKAKKTVKYVDEVAIQLLLFRWKNWRSWEQQALSHSNNSSSQREQIKERIATIDGCIHGLTSMMLLEAKESNQ